VRILGLLAVAIFVIALAGCDFPGGGSSSDDSESGTSTVEALDGDHRDSVAGWATRQGFTGNAKALAGAGVFAQVGCLNCHTYSGTGSSNVGAPDLTAIGRVSRRSPREFADYVADPSKFGNTVMPRFADLGRANLLAIGAFLAASKGARQS